MAFDRNAFQRRVNKARAETRAALDGQFGNHYRALRGLSESEIEAITPDRTDEEVYEVLMATVQEATRQNIEQAELVDRIKELGSVAVSIARKVPSLAALL
ncbi:MAG: hypothetical protein DHS20C03_35560 [Minwuia thermotolerans]|nr:MAG: hypothetical protein DHS20C03_35560 [Minwuia thermotolerans]